jgi:hypothetical protein
VLSPDILAEYRRVGTELTARYPERGAALTPVLALVAMACAGATEAGMAQWLPAFAERSMGFSKSAGAPALTGTKAVSSPSSGT